MSIKKADILQIRKYLNGELDAPAMHRLEREALADPFLMDALEGYETRSNQEANLAELAERLQTRVTKKQGRVIPWMVWPIAASVILALTIGGLMLKKTPEKQLQAANITAPPVMQKDTLAKIAESKAQPAADVKAFAAPKVVDNAVPVALPAKPRGASVYQQEISSADKNIPEKNDEIRIDEPVGNSDVKQVAESPNEIVATGYSSQVIKKLADSSVSDKLKEVRLSRSAQTKLQGKVAGLVVIPAAESRNADPGRITGMIISRTDGSPLIGAAVRINGTNRSTVTDVNGKFSLPSSASKATLDIAYIGYEPKHVSAGGGDSLRVALNADKSALSEVAVAGYGSPKSGDDADNAQPQDGWSKFRKYLQTNAYLPDGTTGNVTLSFIVGIDGGLSNFTILKGLTDAANQKAIDLVKNGPGWKGNEDKPQEVKVKVKFQQQK